MEFKNDIDRMAFIYAYVLVIVMYIFQTVLFLKENIKPDIITAGLIGLSTIYYPIIDKFLKKNKQTSFRFLISLIFYTNIGYLLYFVLSDESTRNIKLINKQSIYAVFIAAVSAAIVSILNIDMSGYFIPTVILFTLTTVGIAYYTKQKIYPDFTPYAIIYMLLVYVMYDTKKCFASKNVNLIACTNSTFLELANLISKSKLKANGK